MKLIFALLLVSILGACKGEAPIATLIVVDKKEVLAEWPDSHYVNSLDSILALEPVIRDTSAKQTKIAMNTHAAPIFKLPQSVTGKKDAPEKAKVKTSNNNKNAPPQKGNAQESFVNKFSDALAKLQSDPSNKNLYRTVPAKAGEDLFALLKRTYGASVNNLPRFYVLSTLQSVNAGVVLEHLNEGDLVRVPKM